MHFLHILQFLCLLTPAIANVRALRRTHVEDLQDLGIAADQCAEEVSTLANNPALLSGALERFRSTLVDVVAYLPNYKGFEPISSGECARIAPAVGKLVDHITHLSEVTSQDKIRCSTQLTPYKTRVITEDLHNLEVGYNHYGQKFRDNCAEEHSLVPYVYQEIREMTNSVAAAIKKFDNRQTECPKASVHDQIIIEIL